MGNVTGNGPLYIVKQKCGYGIKLVVSTLVGVVLEHQDLCKRGVELSRSGLLACGLAGDPLIRFREGDLWGLWWYQFGGRISGSIVLGEIWL
jgi:hypothetical protein